MNALLNFLSGRFVIDEKDSKINGKLKVIRDLAFGVYIEGGGLPQSGGLAKTIWRKTLTDVKKNNFDIKSCLILGLGGGGIATIIANFWSEAVITGVDIDPVMIDLGKKYLELSNIDLQIYITDAFDFVKKENKKYDLICIDAYVGDKFPVKFATQDFFKSVRKLLNPLGIAIFNRLYGGKHKEEADKFYMELRKTFKKVDSVYPEANIMFVCSSFR